MNGYLPLTGTETNPFPVKFIGELDAVHLIKSLPCGPSGTSVSTNQYQDMVFSGKDKLGKPWTITICCDVPGGDGGRGAYFTYTADLDGDGTPDLILVRATGGCGLSPTSDIHCFLFDATGRPMPFATDGYFDYDERGIRDLVDIDRDGKAELVYMNFNDGYWVTSLYKASNGRWQKLQGQIGNRTFPLFTRFTFRDNHTPVAPMSGRHPIAPDLSNASTNLRGRLVSYRWANVEESQDIELHLQTPDNQEVIDKPVSWYSTFNAVLDEPGGRQIVSLDASAESMRALLDKIMDEHCLVSLTGRRNPDNQSPEMLWAVPASESATTIPTKAVAQSANSRNDIK